MLVRLSSVHKADWPPEACWAAICAVQRVMLPRQPGQKWVNRPVRKNVEAMFSHWGQTMRRDAR